MTHSIELYVHRDATGKAVMMAPSPQMGREPELGRIVYLDGNKQRWEFPNAPSK